MTDYFLFTLNRTNLTTVYCFQMMSPADIPGSNGRRRLSSLSSDDGASGTTMGLQTKEKTKQESVWKIEATSAEGCTFICPQVHYKRPGVKDLIDFKLVSC